MPPTYRITGLPKAVRVGDEFTVDLVLDLDGEKSCGQEVSLKFTPNLLEVTEALELGVGADLHEMNLTEGVREIDNLTGLVVQFECASLFREVAPTEPFAVGRITFRALEKGFATILPLFGPGAGLLDGDGKPISVVSFERVELHVRPARGGDGGRRSSS